MEFEKLYPGRGVSAAVAVTAQAPARRVSHGEDTSDTFARILQNLRAAKPANSRSKEDTEGDTVVTRVLADGSVVVQIFRDGKLISENMTRGSDPEAGKEIMSTQVEKLAQKADDPAQNPLLASHAAQGAAGAAAAAMMSTML